MYRLATLIAATDFSAPSRHAVSRAAMLARDTGARMELLHVVETRALDKLRRMMGQQGEAVIQKLLEEARAELMKLAASVGEPVGISMGVKLGTGPLLQEITAQSDSCDAGMLVLGALGAGYMRHLLLGSTAERLLHKSLRPLLVIRRIPQAPYRRVLVPVDFSPWSIESVRFASMAAPSAELILFNAFEVPFEGMLHFAGVEEDMIQQYRSNARRDALRDLRQLATDAGLKDGSYSVSTLHGEAVTRILEQAEEQDIDLIVVGKHGKGMTDELLLGSTTKHVLTESHCDVLVVTAGSVTASRDSKA